ncbi:zinc-dependent alcohol dehydrogenase family protein [Salipiger abyssi]|uniref:Theronine dehydrogenase-like Zn-dependent dehydrogenase n=1 Tax=Salipiger abyssi TaxID=1250539 RepID=A0A1P8V0V0_9RHOB|nr:zinc-binding dehydrogenase [Salipiger abyssi]APZ55245.1 theronine dehydrogenase-like Zn-dependent dehydrogenase [Salipiger abyssi]
MKGVVILGQGELEIREFPDPEPGPDEIVITMKASGMCGTDLHHLREPCRRTEDKIFIEGHEPCGVVSAVGEAVHPQEASVGDRVMIHHYDGCRVCQYCRSGWTQLCPNAKVIYGGPNGHGAHAQFMKVPAHTAIQMPDGLSFKAGAAISCGAGTAYGAVKRVDLCGDDTVAIFGQGPVGLAATILAKEFGARVIALDIGEERLQMAKNFGADFTVNPLKEDPVEAIRALTIRGEGATKSLECSSNPDARRQAIQCVKRWGTACMVGAYGDISFSTQEIIQLQKTVLGSLTFSKNMMDDCAQWVVQRGIDLEKLFTHEFRLDQAHEAYELFDQQKIGKGVFVFD